ncbi:Fur family transcriptional regulator [Paratissierella segnis]|jgi:Fe2+ or Zn2+ uptake regulation protein|uniref:Transcriptional repressor n=1 Tax=Paratissierella segnis TaxID=2763679 RepID=A0A926EVX8_9FIRM|nr:Fur family transcriptional regulator [Paratissierella segnis]MBC8587449.1 transcriptional repressor [Paratissierella segnis]
MDISIKKIAHSLSAKGIKPSHQRIKIMEYLLKNRCHPTVDMIYTDLQEEIPTLSKTTVYNTLNLFTESELVRVLSIDGIESKYDINVENHGHFICESCGKLYDFPIDIDKYVIDELIDFKINEKNVYYKGICPRCLKK